jgi:hypothetical protein
MTETIYQILDRIEAVPEIEVVPDISSLDFLRAIYRDPNQPMQRRMRAAIAALPFEHPKLAVTVGVNGSQHFAARLEAAIARVSKATIIDARPITSIEDESSND